MFVDDLEHGLIADAAAIGHSFKFADHGQSSRMDVGIERCFGRITVDEDLMHLRNVSLPNVPGGTGVGWSPEWSRPRWQASGGGESKWTGKSELQGFNSATILVFLCVPMFRMLVSFHCNPGSFSRPGIPNRSH